jgi:hypothetical protein
MNIFYDWMLYGKLVELAVFSQIWVFQLGGM